MALRNLLRRLPLRSLSGPLMGPVHGVSPATAAAVPRFLATQSEGEQRLPEAYVETLEEREKRMDKLWEVVKAYNDEAIKARESFRKELDEMEDDVRRWVDDLPRFERKWRMFAHTSAAVCVSSSVLLIYYVHHVGY
ncbi:hypothetical protein QOZ80_8AG0640670 [Eleusine coracana subsp. coracana]|nr:hypothetical protein QOZ80_8AG0640670 [Eleusine coracana subsp. coracana]